MNACFRYRTIISLLPLFQRNNTFECIRAQKSTHTRELDVESNVSLLCFSTPRAAQHLSTAFLQRQQASSLVTSKLFVMEDPLLDIELS